MSLRHILQRAVIVIAATSFVSACSRSEEPISVDSAAEDTMDSLVSAEWLAEHIDDPDLVVLDCTVLVEPAEGGAMRSISGRARYEAGHIPSAGFADLKHDLADADSRLEFAVPSPADFAAAMGALGVGDDTRVVLYDSNNSVWAARVWWMLRWIGFDRAALLDGGLDAWTAGGWPLSTEEATRPARKLTVNLRPELIAGRDEVFAAIDNDSVDIIDVLPEAHYRGEMSMYARPGHITGALNVPVFALFDDKGRFRSDEELKGLFDTDHDARAITYCGGGIAASASAFAMTRLGYPDVAIYAASLEEWAADPANPMETILDMDDPDE